MQIAIFVFQIPIFPAIWTMPNTGWKKGRFQSSEQILTHAIPVCQATQTPRQLPVCRGEEGYRQIPVYLAGQSSWHLPVCRVEQDLVNSRLAEADSCLNRSLFSDYDALPALRSHRSGHFDLSGGRKRRLLFQHLHGIIINCDSMNFCGRRGM